MLKTLRLLVVIAAVVYGQEPSGGPLDNDAVIKLVKDGLGESSVIETIQTQPGNYTLTSDALVKLQQNGVSDRVLGAMIAHANGTSRPVLGAPPMPPASLGLPQDVDTGVYFKKSGKWEEMLPEVVNWKSGGVVKRVTSAATSKSKADLDGHLPGAHSQNSADSPLEVLIYAPEGVAIDQYQLLQLRDVKGDREFRALPGGEPTSKTPDLLSFDSKKVANRMYQVVLPKLRAGEYGFLPAPPKGASIGKMYTFRVVE